MAFYNVDTLNPLGEGQQLVDLAKVLNSLGDCHALHCLCDEQFRLFSEGDLVFSPLHNDVQRQFAHLLGCGHIPFYQCSNFLYSLDLSGDAMDNIFHNKKLAFHSPLGYFGKRRISPHNPYTGSSIEICLPLSNPWEYYNILEKPCQIKI